MGPPHSTSTLAAVTSAAVTDEAAAAHRPAAPCAESRALPAMQVGDRLFRGNRTEILLIEHPTHGVCAQKRLLDFCNVKSERARIAAEATLQMRAHQPGIVPVFGHDDASLYRRYVPGPTLAQWVKEQPKTLPPHQVLSIVSSLCDTVAGLHQARPSGNAAPRTRNGNWAIVHRDITPSNVYLDDHQVLLSDFGLAFAGEPPRRSQFLQGSPRFLAPELLTGHPPSTASDVYQVALLMAWLLEEPLRKFAAPSARGLSVGEQWSRARAWHEPARQVLKAYRCDTALDPDPRGRPSARELGEVIHRSSR